MHISVIERLISPETGNPLEIEVFVSQGDEIIEGRLMEVGGNNWFRIENGIADLLPLFLRDAERHSAFAARRGLSYEPLLTETRPDDLYQRQIGYFASHHNQYEAEVVESPFYKVLDSINFEDWVDRMVESGNWLLEIGCGSGRQTQSLIRKGARVVGVDLSENLLGLARKKIIAFEPKAQIGFVIGAAERVPVKREAFDGSLIYGSLHHFSEPSAALLEAGAALKPGGMFYLLEPHASPVRFVFDWLMRLRPLWQEEANDDPLFVEANLKQWLAAAGIRASFRFSTYVPPHLFYFLGQRMGERLLTFSDSVGNAVPGLKRLGGVIIAEGSKAS